MGYLVTSTYCMEVSQNIYRKLTSAVVTNDIVHLPKACHTPATSFLRETLFPIFLIMGLAWENIRTMQGYDENH